MRISLVVFGVFDEMKDANEWSVSEEKLCGGDLLDVWVGLDVMDVEAEKKVV